MKAKHFKSRHALLMSLTSLTLCVSMLFGATFAWFTDSVTSGVNRIVSGNLDVELYHSNDSTAEEKVQATTQLFKAAYIDSTAVNPHQLWEPGAMTYETFRVENKGSLALTYQLNLSDIAYNYVTWGDDTTQYNLTEVIKVGLIPNTAAISRNTVKQYATQNLKALLSGTTATMKTASLEPGASESFTVALYWAEADNATDNHYNLKNGVKSAANPNGWTLNDSGTELYLDSRITLFATQYTSESDSFDNQYDASAVASSIPAFANASVISTTAAVTASEDTNLTVGNLATATVPAAAASTLKDENGSDIVTDSSTLTSLTLEVKELEVAPTTGSQDEATIAITADEETAGSAIQSFDVSLFATTTTETMVGTETTTTTNTTAVKSSDQLITATLNIGAGKVITKVYHRSAELTTTADATTGEYYGYNSDTGILTLYVKSFSPFAVAYTVPVTGVTLDKTTTKIGEGDSETLTATVLPADATDATVTWSSSDTSVATVNANGVVTGVAKGTATITATAGNKSKSCAVTVVKEGEGEPVAVELNEYGELAKAITLTAPINGGIATATIEYASVVSGTTELKLIIQKSETTVFGRNALAYTFNVDGIGQYDSYDVSFPCAFDKDAGDAFFGINAYRTADITSYVGSMLPYENGVFQLSNLSNGVTYAVAYADPAEAALVDLKDIQTDLSVNGATIAANDENAKGDTVKSTGATITADNFTLKDLHVLAKTDTNGGLFVKGNGTTIDNSDFDARWLGNYADTIKIQGSNTTVKDTSITHYQTAQSNGRYAGLELTTDTAASVTTIDHVTFKGMDGLLFRSFAGTVNITNSTFDVSNSAMQFNMDSGPNTGKVSVKDSSIKAKSIGFMRVKNGVTFENTTFETPSGTGSLTVKTGDNVTTNIQFTGCTFNNELTFPGSTTSGFKTVVSFENCTYLGEEITAGNIQNLFSFSVGSTAYHVEKAYDGTQLTITVAKN